MSATWKDLFNVPIITLKNGVKDFVEISFNYWANWLEENSASHKCCGGGGCGGGGCGSKTEASADESEQEESNIAEDLSKVLDNNKAIAEKYQASGAESLLNHLAAQLATVRKCDKENVLNEIKEALYVPDEKRALLAMHKVERAEFLARQVIDANPDSLKAIFNGDKTAVKQLDKAVVENAHGLVNDADLKLALRHMLREGLTKMAEKKEDGEASDDA